MLNGAGCFRERDETMVKLYALRHGQTDYNVHKIYQGTRIDTSLNEDGIKEAELARAAFYTIPLDVIITNRLKRCAETAKPISDDKGLELVVWDETVEIDHGSLDGTSYVHIPDIWPSVFDSKNRGDGETVEHVYARAESVKERLLREYADKKILIVSSQGFLAMFCCSVFGIGAQNIREYMLGNGNVHYFELDNDGKPNKYLLNQALPLRTSD